MSPGLSWMAICAFALLGSGVVFNMLVLQDEAVTSAVTKAQAARAAQKAKSDRQRRLAVDDTAATPGLHLASSQKARNEPPRTSVAVAPPPASVPSDRLSAVASRIARLAQESARLDTPLAEPGSETASVEIVKTVQRELVRKGYDTGTQDGVPGLMTRAAIMAFEWDHGLALSAEPTEALLQNILLSRRAPGLAGAGAPQRSRQAAQVIRTIQQSLVVLGYLQGSVDGHLGDATQRAIREFEMDNGLVPSGRISPPLVGKLARSAAAGRLSTPR